MALDGFLEIEHQGGAVAIKGECRDRTFAVRGAMAITSFEFGSEGAGAADGSEKPSHKKGRQSTGPGPTSPKVVGGVAAPQLKIATGEAATAVDKEVDWTTTLFFKITKEVDLATPELFMAYCQNTQATCKPFELARVTLRRAGGSEPQVFFVVEFREVLVTSFSIQGGSKDDLPEETVEFTFKRMIKVKYQPQTLDGHGAANIKDFKLRDRPKATGS